MSDVDDLPPEVDDPEQFDPEDASIDDRLELRMAFAETITQHGFPDTLVLAREQAGDIFHDRRLEIIDHLTEHDPSSVRELAETLGYDKGVVSRDLTRLAGIDVIEYVDDGRAKAPRLKHDHVAIEPIV